MDAKQADDAQTLSAQFYKAVGEMASLMAFSPMHAHFTIRDVSDIMMPPVLLGQYRVYSDPMGRAVAFVSWGAFSDDAARRFLNRNTVLAAKEWRSGENYFITDMIAPFGHARRVVKDLKSSLFSKHVVYALRYHAPGSPRGRVSTFFGDDLPRQWRSSRAPEWNAALAHGAASSAA